MPFNDLQEVIASPDQAERHMHATAKAGDWSHAVYVAHGLPVNWGAFEKLPQYGIPEKHAETILDTLSNQYSPHHQNLPNFLFEYSQNLSPKASPEHLSRVAHLGRDDMYVTANVHEHPNWRPDEETQGRSKAANFWSDYESHVKPSHFAAVGSMYSGKEEALRDHRGNSGTSEEYKDAIPHLQRHAKAVQEEVMKDEFIPKRWFNGEPHIQVHRGVGGNYGQMIRNKANYNPDTNEIDHKRMRIPTAAFSSWSTDHELARSFAHSRDDIPNQPKKQGVVMSRWVPLKDVLHTGFHRVVTGQQHPHFSEYEVIVGHPKGHIDVSTKDMHFVQPTHPFGTTAQGKVRKITVHNPYPVSMEVSGSDETVPGKVRPAKIEKGIKEMLVAGSLMMPTTMAIHPMEAKQQQQQQKQQQKASPFLPRGSHPMDKFLDSISQLESSGGKNTAHKPSFGFHGGNIAVGEHAVMPLTAQFVARHSKDPLVKPLSEMAPHDISQKLQQDPDLTHEVAREYADSLSRRFNGNLQMMAHAWRHGPNAKMDHAGGVKNNPYVAAFSTAYATPKPAVNEIQGKLKKLQGMVKPK